MVQALMTARYDFNFRYKNTYLYTLSVDRCTTCFLKFAIPRSQAAGLRASWTHTANLQCFKSNFSQKTLGEIRSYNRGKGYGKMLYSSTYRKEENESIFPEFYVQEKTSEIEFWSLALSFGCISNFKCFKSNFSQNTLEIESQLKQTKKLWKNVIQ